MKTSERYHIRVRGVVQGVGFRPFVYRLATELELNGWVRNVPGGVDLEVEGTREAPGRLMLRLRSESPSAATIRSIDADSVVPSGERGFRILDSEESVSGTATEILADLATCDACLEELFEPNNRRYLYPFTNCVHCGPRYSIIREMPYDRPRTSLSQFVMCAQCRAEYADPLDRRFHAQPISCPNCGPRIEWQVPGKSSRVFDGDALSCAVELIKAGRVVAIKGLGGFHLFGDATNEGAIHKLRERKKREAKPFAVMFGSSEAVSAECQISAAEAELLTSPAAPIVLLKRRKKSSTVVPLVAPENPFLGVMLPYTPLYHMILRFVGRPLVATSGNLSEESICFENGAAMDRLRNVADGFLMHNYAIQRAVDDSVVRVAAGRELVLRRARGYAPVSVDVGWELAPVVALGSDLKNTIAVTNGNTVFVSQHIGDLSSADTIEVFKSQRTEFPRLMAVEPVAWVKDQHPGYFSGRLDLGDEISALAVQHHHAHVAACLAENGLREEVLGVVWDGAGFGTDEAVWGGEFLIATLTKFLRFAHLRPFSLIGGDQAARRPSLAALGLIFELGIDPPAMLRQEFSQRELTVYQTMVANHVNCPRTSSMGRLFDAVAALAGVSIRNRFEGESAMKLEFALPAQVCDQSYAVPQGNPLDWKGLILEILTDVERGVATEIISARFHNAMVKLILQVAGEAKRSHVALTGGCFQNRYLLERTVAELDAAGFKPIWHQRVPPNDGGLALGQACIAGRELSKG